MQSSDGGTTAQCTVLLQPRWAPWKVKNHANIPQYLPWDTGVQDRCSCAHRAHLGFGRWGPDRHRVLRPHRALSLVQSPQPVTSAVCVSLTTSHGMSLPPQGRAHCPPAPPWKGPAQPPMYLMPRRVLTRFPTGSLCVSCGTFEYKLCMSTCAYLCLGTSVGMRQCTHLAQG